MWSVVIVSVAYSTTTAESREGGDASGLTAQIGRFPGESSCLSLCWAVLDLMIAGARGLGLTAFERQQLAQMRSERLTPLTEELSA
jgi:putative transposase